MTVARSFKLAGARPLAVAVLWAFAIALTGGAIVGLASLVAGGVAGVLGLFGGETSVTGAMGATLQIAAWVFAPLGVAVAVWAAAYGATRQGSVPRTLVAAPAAIGVAVALLFLGSSGLLAAGLAIGWALAMPGESPTHVAARSMPLLVAALFVPRLDDVSGWTTVGFLIASPVVAAVGVFAADLIWGLRGSSPELP